MKMLLRSSSAPISDSWLPHYKDFSLVTQPFLQLSRTRSVSLTCSFRSPSTMDDDEDDEPAKKASLALSEADLTIPPKPKQNNINPISHCCRKQPEIKAKECEEEEEEEKPKTISRSPSPLLQFQRLFSSSGLGYKSTNNEESGIEKRERLLLQTMLGGGGVGNNGGDCTGIGGGLDGGDEEEGLGGFSESDGVDTYYHRMIEARFLKEIRGHDAKAEEYYGRAILGSKSVGIVLSRLADLIWTTYGDADRADTYFQQAVKICNDDCYVAAAYARFLWDDDAEK